MKIERCQEPNEPGLFLVRRRKGGMLTIADVRRNKQGLLEVHTYFTSPIAIPGFGSEAKWWGPIELSKGELPKVAR